MAQIRRTTEELLAEEEEKRKQVRDRMAELKARQRIEERKRDTHRKIVAGAGLIAYIKIDPRFRKTVQDALNRAVTDPKHRAVIPDLLDETAFQEAMRAAAKKAAAEAKEAADAEQAKEAAVTAGAKQASEPANAAGGEGQPAAASRPQRQGESGRQIQRATPV